MKILMVCLGNICRSPMAEGILKDKAEKSGYSLQTDSAGTNDFHTGEPPDRRAIKCAASHGIDISNLRARTFIQADFDEFDRIYAMDRQNLATILSLSRHADDRAKVRLLPGPDKNGGALLIPDPWFGKDDDFQDVFKMLEGACERVIAELAEGR